MDEWDQDFVDADEEGYFEFGEKGNGEFHFGFVHGHMDCLLTTRGGEPAVEWSWDCNGEMDAAQGRGWAIFAFQKLKLHPTPNNASTGWSGHSKEMVHSVCIQLTNSRILLPASVGS